MCFDYDEHAEFSSSKSVITRKQHRCCGCNAMISPGQSAKCHSGLFDGAFFRKYTCDSCERMIYSIAADEIEHGCSWSDAWCAPEDLRDYIKDRAEPVKILPHATLAECERHVVELWMSESGQRQKSTARAG